MDIKEIRDPSEQGPIDPDIRYLLDVFSGADGGADFIMFQSFIETMKKRAEDGDTAAEQIVQILRRFTKLVRVGTRMK